MPAATYGQFSPGGIDPWPIESELAKAAATSPVRAEQLLENYQQERGAASNVYLSEMDTQHQFAKQQLANQLYEAKMKTLPELIKQPGGAGFLQHGGIAGLTPADISADPNAWAGLVAAGDAANSALNIKNVGQGVQGLSNAGTAFSNTNQVLPSLNIPMGENVQVQRARIDAAAKLGAASMRGARGGREDKTTDTFNTYSVDDQGNKVPAAIKIRRNATDEQAQQVRDNFQRRQQMIYGGQGSNVPGLGPADGNTAPNPPATVGTSSVGIGRGGAAAAVPPARTPAPSPGAQTGNPTVQGSQYVVDPRIQGLSKQAFPALPQAARADVVANVKGGIVPVVRLTDGTLAFKGASGAIHRVPAAGGGNAAQ
jgi:hypothetical protein